MAFVCHDTSFNGFTTPECCFIPDTVEEVNDCRSPAVISFVKKKTQYLPGEKLLISLNKQRKKNKKNSDQSLDIDRLASSLSRIF